MFWFVRWFVVAFCLGVAPALAQDWPSKPVAIYMGFPAGSGTDVVARLLQPSLEKTLGQRLVIDYKPGAGPTFFFHHYRPFAAEAVSAGQALRR